MSRLIRHLRGHIRQLADESLRAMYPSMRCVDRRRAIRLRGRRFRGQVRPERTSVPTGMHAWFAWLTRCEALLHKWQAGHTAFVALWGLAFGGVSVAWSNSATRMVPDRAESAGGIVAVGVQSGIAAGAAAGGAIFGFGGVVAVFTISGGVLIVSALLIALSATTPSPLVQA